jgi:hypothetical protein
MLNFVVRFSYCFYCIVFEKSVLQYMVEVDNQVPCILHMHKRKIIDINNKSAFGTVDDPITYKVPFDSKTGTVADLKFDDSRANTLEEELSKILPILITKEESQKSQKSEWI